MAQYGPASSFLLVGGRNISGDTFTLDETVENVLEETHGLGDLWEESLPVGLARVLLEAGGGIYDDRVGGIMEALQAKGATLQIVDYGFSGYAIGGQAVALNGTYATTWKRISSREGLTHAHALHKITGRYCRSRVLHGITAETTDPGPGYGASVDRTTDIGLPACAITSSSVANPTHIITPVNHYLTSGDIIVITGHTGSNPNINGGNGYAVTVVNPKEFTIPVNVTTGGTGGTFQIASSRGAVANLHVLALVLGGFTNIIFKVQHSADNSSFSDLMTFSTVTTEAFSEQQSTAVLVNRWTRMSWDWTGAGSSYSVTPYISVGRLT